MGGWQFSANLLPTALIDGPSQFDLIDGGHCRTAALAFAEYDAEGVVNVSRFGTSSPGAGGYIDIAMNARKLVLTGTFTTGGLDVDRRDGGLAVRREGAIRKFVARAQDVTYRVAEGVRNRGQGCLIVTERAVFRVEPGGLALVEVARGVDVRRDILDQMGFAPGASPTRSWRWIRPCSRIRHRWCRDHEPVPRSGGRADPGADRPDAGVG